MKLKALLELVIAVVFASLVSSLTVKAQEDTSPSSFVTKIYFVNTSQGWALAEKKDSSFILKTNDGGDHWVEQYRAKQAGFFGIKFANSDVGWVIGNGGIILHTSDGGVTWQNQVSGTTAVLTGLSIIDADRVWVSGPVGTLLFTTDGGRTWSMKKVNAQVAISDIMFVDKQHGWAVGYGTIFSTSDGGDTWEVKSSGDWKPLSSVFFANKDIGWITVGPVILRTTDGGKTWKETIPPSQGRIAGLSFIDAQHGWVAKSRGEEGSIVHVPGHDKLSSESFILSTNDGGSTWRKMFHIKSDKDHSAWIINIFFLDRSRGWAIGRDGLILRTVNGGKTWSRLQSILRNQ